MNKLRQIPNGKKGSDCLFLGVCTKYHKFCGEENRECEWYPVRFLDKSEFEKIIKEV